MKRGILHPHILTWERAGHWARLLIGVAFVTVRHVCREQKTKRAAPLGRAKVRLPFANLPTGTGSVPSCPKIR